jgi:hypothetical protein
MSLSLITNASAMAINLTMPFQAIGGVAPYTYSVAAGGAGGSINSATGLYTSPSQTGVDEVIVTDSASATAELSISICSPIELVCDIVQTCMGLGAGQVYLYNQKYTIPTDSSLYVAIGVLSCKPFGNNRQYVSNSGTLNETRSTNFQSTLSIEILSRSTQALTRKEELLLALGSTYAESQMELNSFFVAPLTSSFMNLSASEGPAILYRFNISVNIQYAVSITDPVNFYSIFQTPQIVPNS